jgi:2-polyprenyl-3-methyl-5-hydroxy-6-metoxy-1,4-benzoquinol methylase
MKILVTIASYGNANDRHLARLITEYSALPFQVDIKVLSNINKTVSPPAEIVVVDLQGKDPWTLPFTHKQIFAERLNEYDLFIYSEDDVLITHRNICAFLEVSKVLPEDEIAGFLRFERGPDGRINYPEIHGRFHWDPGSVRRRGEYVLAFFTNEHSACYVLTQQQLRHAIDSGGFLQGPREGRYDLLCTAATDPYTQCGFRKVICISRIEDFLVHHLPNKYVGSVYGVDKPELCRQLEHLKRVGLTGHTRTSLFQTETKFAPAVYSKEYYEPVKADVVSAIPADTRSVLSIGCGWGAMEVALASKGMRVVAIPLDPIIVGGVDTKGVEIIHGDFESGHKKLVGQQFDCLLLSNVLHLVPKPVDLLSSFGEYLTKKGKVVVLVPNVLRFPTYWKNARGKVQSGTLQGFERTGFHLTSHKIVRRWFREAGMKVESIRDVLPPRCQKVSRISLGIMDARLSVELIAVGRQA